MKVAIINDTHAGIRNSSDIFADNANKFYSEVFFPGIRERGIKRILHLGDVFDNRKFINFKSLHNYRKNFLTKLREYGIHMDVIPGNHDTYYKNTNELNSLKELLGHYMNEVTIHMDPSVLNYDGFKMAVLPWICADNYDRSIEFIKNCKADWLGGHLELMGFDVLKGVPAHNGMDPDLFNRFEQVISGHYHTKSEKGNVKYLGTQMEFFWSDAHDPKHFHILDTETRELEAVLNPHTLFHRIYYDDSKQDYSDFDLEQVDHKFVKIVVINKADLFTFDRFIDRIQDRPIHELKIAENFNEFIGENVNDQGIEVEETETLLDSYVDAVDTDLDKDRLKVNMRTLLTEAQALEIA
jgi:DNA repair exonuclease SbcCD nuclease subunit